MRMLANDNHAIKLYTTHTRTNPSQITGRKRSISWNANLKITIAEFRWGTLCDFLEQLIPNLPDGTNLRE